MTSFADDTLLSTIGPVLRSNYEPSVSYEIVRRVGTGGMSVAYLATRKSAMGQEPVVIKVLRPRFVRQFGTRAIISVQKEAVALGRLNERIPPTPFVVRLIEVGTVPARFEGQQWDAPWIAVEYVHGGPEGTTLLDRVQQTLRQTGTAFDPERAAQAIKCMTKGLAAVHEVGVIHRDLKPENVLCCGFGRNEMFKIADFGVARPAGVKATFGGNSVGTPGYAAPELIVSDATNTKPWTDVFGLAAVIYLMLAGKTYFKARTVAEAIMEIQQGKRPKLLDSERLHPSLRERPNACHALDQALAHATATDPLQRPRDMATLGASLIPWLKMDTGRRAVSSLGASTTTWSRFKLQHRGGWSWLRRLRPLDNEIVRSVAWDGDGHCMAATNEGLAFWNGTGWKNVPLDGLPNSKGIRFVHRLSAGRWLVGCDEATFAVLTEDGTRDIMRLGDEHLRVQAFSGNLKDIGVMATLQDDRTPQLHTVLGQRWLRPIPLTDLTALTSMARVGDATWLIAGRDTSGHGGAYLYSPLDFDVEKLQSPQVRAYLSCGGHPDIAVGLVGGASGVVLYMNEHGSWEEHVPGDQDVSSVEVGPSGTCWAAGAGRIWQRVDEEGQSPRWIDAWVDPSWEAPIVSIFADAGLVLAVGADGGIVEGRSKENLT